MRQLRVGPLTIRVGCEYSNSWGGVKVVWASRDRRRSIWIFEAFIPRQRSLRSRRIVKVTDPILSFGIQGRFREWWSSFHIPRIVMVIAAGMPGRREE